MTIYTFHAKTKELLTIEQSDVVIHNSTSVEPLAIAGLNKTQVFVENDNAWKEVVDYRGRLGITELNVSPDQAAVLVEELAHKKAVAIKQMKSLRTLELVKAVEYDGNTYDTDPAARQSIVSVLPFMEPEEAILWSTADNKEVSLTREDLVALGKLLVANTSNIYVKSRVLRSSIEESQEPEKVLLTFDV